MGVAGVLAVGVGVPSPAPPEAGAVGVVPAVGVVAVGVVAVGAVPVVVVLVGVVLVGGVLGVVAAAPPEPPDEAGLTRPPALADAVGAAPSASTATIGIKGNVNRKSISFVGLRG